MTNKLAQYLDDEGLSQAEFADRAGMKPSHVSMIASGKRGAGLKAALAIEKGSGGQIPASYWATVTVVGWRRRLRRAERRAT